MTFVGFLFFFERLGFYQVFAWFLLGFGQTRKNHPPLKMSSGALDLTNLHTDIYVVTDVNPGGKKFDKVNRLVCKGQDAQADLVIDIASVEYSLAKGDRFKMCLSGTLRIDGKADEDVYNQDGKVSTLWVREN